MQATEMGGFKEVTLTLEGEGVYRDLQYESEDIVYNVSRKRRLRGVFTLQPPPP